MAEKNYPQIPSTVWWGVRSLLQKNPRIKLTEQALAVQLSVQPAAARQYVAELKRTGLLEDDGQPTQLAQDWRLDEKYQQAVEVLLSNNYPDDLIGLAPPDPSERTKIVAWFMSEGLGQGTAGNKAATYLLIGSREPNEAPSRPSQIKADGRARGRNSDKPTKKSVERIVPKTPEELPPQNKTKAEFPPLNLNLQIHISADASSEQIEAIFAAMKKYLSS